MAGFDNNVVYGVNGDFSGQIPVGALANTIQTNGQLWIGRTVANTGGTHIDVNTLTAGTGISIVNGAGTIEISSTAATTDLHVARFIVASSTSGTGANFTTIAAAIAAAVLTGINSTIFIQPGTYVENLTLRNGINLCAFDCDALTPNVTISGTLTMTEAGTVSISGIRLQTNGAAFLAVTGSAASIVNLNNCYLTTAFDPGITFSSSSASAEIQITNCSGDISAAAKKFFAHSSAGALVFRNCSILNSGASTSASTCSAGTLFLLNCVGFLNPFTVSGTGSITIENCNIDTANQGVTCLTAGGSNDQIVRWSRFASGAASAVSVGTTLVMVDCEIFSNNTNAITGAGTLHYALTAFTGSSSTVNTTTQTPLETGPIIFAKGGISFDSGTNTLNIFQQGSFSPVVVGSIVAGTVTMTTAVARWQKIGRIVTVNMVCDWSTIGTATGTVVVNNLPFTVANQTSSTAPSFVAPDVNPLALSTNAVALMQPVPNTTTCRLLQYVGGAATGGALVTITATNGFNCLLVYETA